MKSKFICILILFALINCLNAQEKLNNEQLLDSILFLAKENSVYKNKVDWNTITQKVKASLDLKDTTPNALAKPTQLLLTELNDFHGSLLINGQRYMGSAKNDDTLSYKPNQEISSTLYHESLSGYKVETEMMTKNIG